MSQISVIINIPNDGKSHTVTVKSITPLHSKRIRGVYCEYAGREEKIEFDNKATVGIKVAGREILPNNFPARWMSSGYWIRRYEEEENYTKRKSCKWVELPMDESAEGSEIEITLTSKKTLVFTFELDDKPVGPMRKRYQVESIIPTNGWQRNYLIPGNSYANELVTSRNIQLGGMFKGIFCEYDVNLDGLALPHLIKGDGHKFYGAGPANAAPITAITIPQKATDVLATRMSEVEYMKAILQKHTWLTVTTTLGVEIISLVNAGLLCPTPNISFKHAELRKAVDSDRLSFKVLFPYFFNGSPAVTQARNDLPFTEAQLVVCLTFSEKK